MIIYSRLGKKGNLGNQLFQIASTIGISKKNHHNFGFPEWQYSDFFVYNLPTYDLKLNYQPLREISYQYYEIEIDKDNYDLIGWFQSEKYFDIESTRKYLKFQPELIKSLEKKYKKALSKKNILISVRRGDFVNHPYYFQLDYKYYFLAIVTQFADWQERSLIFTSDDISYCKRHFKFLPNATFVDKSNVIEQLVLASLCDDFIISNSTFSWWQAWLGECETTKIIRPIQNFRGNYKLANNDADYFPNRWLIFNPESHRISMKYWKLVVIGEYLKYRDLMNHYYKVSLKQIKKSVKGIIGIKRNS